jgi:cytochrome P450
MTDVATVQRITIDQLPYLDMESEEFIKDSNQLLTKMRDRTWAARTHLGIILFDYDVIETLLPDPRFRQPGINTFEVQGVHGGAGYDIWNKALMHLEGEDHLRIRRMANGVFSAKSIDSYRPLMRATARQLAAKIPAEKTFDFVADFADQLPMSVAGTLIGAPREDHRMLARWTHDFGLIGPAGLLRNLPKIDQAVESLRSYVRQLHQDRAYADAAGSDLLGKLITVQREQAGISNDELVDLVAIMLLGGQDTTRFQLGHAMVFFLERPELWAELANNPGLATHAATEVIRYRPSVPENFRCASEDAVINGLEVPKGTYISISSAAANLSEKCTNNASEFRLGRPPAPHLTFGKGPHFCIGQALARAEIEEALATLPPLMPVIRPEGRVESHIPRSISGPEKIPMSYSDNQK